MQELLTSVDLNPNKADKKKLIEEKCIAQL
jgi:hypothetical protein